MKLVLQLKGETSIFPPLPFVRFTPPFCPLYEIALILNFDSFSRDRHLHFLHAISLEQVQAFHVIWYLEENNCTARKRRYLPCNLLIDSTNMASLMGLEDIFHYCPTPFRGMRALTLSALISSWNTLDVCLKGRRPSMKTEISRQFKVRCRKGSRRIY